MSTFFGYEFERGPEVPRPVPFDWTQSWGKVESARAAWAEAILDAAGEHDAWGLLCMKPNCDVEVRDVLTPGAVLEATRYATVHLLLAREVQRLP